MEERKGNRVVWIVLGALLGLLVVVGVSATVGGIAGYVAGRSAAGAHECLGESAPELRIVPWERAPHLEPELPRLPRGQMPDLDRFDDLPLGALITSVAESSPAEKAGLEVGNMIIAIDGVPLAAEDDLVDLIAEYEPGDRIELALAQPGDELGSTLEVILGRHPDRGGETAYLGITFRMVPVGVFGGRMPFRNR